MNAETVRRWLVRGMYAAVLAHLLVGLLLPLVSNVAVLDAYHRVIEHFFWGGSAPVAARAQQVWWMSLFGATVQAMALWMLALVHFADRQRNAAMWGWLIAGLLLWAPQDMLLSARAAVWPNLWADGLALLTMLPPLFWLCLHDARHHRAVAATE